MQVNEASQAITSDVKHHATAEDNRRMTGDTFAAGALELGEIVRTVNRPPFRQIADCLRTAIQNGRYGPRDQLPSEFALSHHFGVARMTVRRAISELRAEGLVSPEHGRGVFVNDTAKSFANKLLTRDDVVALKTLVEAVTGRSLSDDQSSALKSAYHAANVQHGGPTLQAVAQLLARSGGALPLSDNQWVGLSDGDTPGGDQLMEPGPAMATLNHPSVRADT
ncbi:GntR family transcriptional regulator [Mycobacterium gordonae]|nr:GntR family transcriptional regulator [Mycobacterium gordonae]